MKTKYTAEEIIEITQGRLAQGMMPDESGVICTDTRTLNKGDWFLALPGKNFDGHDFLGDAFSAGALGAIVTERASYPIAATSFPLIAVQDTPAAYKALNTYFRNN